MLNIRRENATGVIFPVLLLIAGAMLLLSISGIWGMLTRPGDYSESVELPPPITGTFKTGVLKDATYKLKKSQYRPTLEVELRLYNELVTVYYYVPGTHGYEGWRSAYGKLRPEVEQQLVQSFSSYTTELEYEHKRANAFRDLINYQGDKDGGE